MKPADSWMKRMFTVDRRSLGLFRIALGLLLSIDSFHRLFLARALYSDWGVMPRAHWIENFMVPMKFSIHLASGDTWFQLLLIGSLLLASLALLVGWHARLANVVVLVLLCSQQSRNNLILSASDELLRLMVVWSLFLPIGDRFSVHSNRREPNRALH
ncbi:MAG TPA: HTTM domain-containing protein, partial [Bdellovibrionota bacterium]